MRAGKATFSLVLLGAAIFLLWSPKARSVSLVGIVVALTPMAVFLSATLNPSGLEIMSAVAFISAALHLTRYDGAPKQAWISLGISGVVLALSRTQGPVWIVLSLCVIAPIYSANQSLRLALQQKQWSGPAAIAIVVAIFLNRLWEYLHGPRLIFDPTPLLPSLLGGFARLPDVLLQQIGVFNYLEFGLPPLAYALWRALTVALGVTAFLVGTRRERVILLISSGLALALPVLLVATTMRHTGFGLQGRYVLAFSIVVPLLAGEILVRRHERLRALKADQLFIAFATVTAFVQFLAWWTNAHRFAVGVAGPRWFLSTAEWSPPLGWWPWLIVAAAGACLLVAAALADWRTSVKQGDSSDFALESSTGARP